ncbi:MAG: TIGR02217 family protein, partial [Alphaproteobacteria bacterium]|nr:TIGR02217 family protein [Alphaproteobacteria bacterium]
MSFDDVSLPHRLAFGAVGGPQFNTDVVMIDNGFEKRNQNWAGARRRYQLQQQLRSAQDVATLISFFHARAGRARGFRFKDWADFTTASNHTSAPAATNIVLGTGNGTQTQFQLKKIYTSGAITHERAIKKPVSGTVVVSLNDVAQATGW